jgi:type VI secretion system protein ImpK
MKPYARSSSIPSWQDAPREQRPFSATRRPEFFTEPVGSSLLLERARELFTELIQLSQRLRAISRPSGQVLPGPSVEEIRQRLLARVEQQTRLEGTPRGSLQEHQLEKCRYVLATFADELLVNTPWYGRDAWREGLLEDVLYGTHHAGERIFEDVQRLLRERDPTQAELAAVYLLALSLGFQGRYRDHGEEALLHELQHQLFVLVHQRQPEPESPSHRLMPQTYAHTLDERTDRRLAPRWPWAAAIATALLVFVSSTVAVRIVRTPDLVDQNAKHLTQEARP